MTPWTFPTHRPRRYRPVPWRRLTDAEYEAFRPFILNTGPGRPVRDLRGRLDAIFRIATTNIPWSRISTDCGPTSSLHRLFRRWAHAGVWTRLLRCSVSRRAPRPLRALRGWIAAAFRRCVRLLGLPAITLARRLRVFRALPGPSWYFPDPDLSESLQPVLERAVRDADIDLLRLCRRILRVAGRRRSIPRCLVPEG
jgi:hypothetical protein